MSDQKPPQFADDERATVRRLLQYQRESFVRKVTGVDDADAARPLVATGTPSSTRRRHSTRARRRRT
jgi:hypothetical protein